MYSELNTNKEAALLTFQIIRDSMPDLYKRLEVAMDQETFLNQVAERISAEAIYDAALRVRSPGKMVPLPLKDCREVELVIDVYRSVIDE